MSIHADLAHVFILYYEIFFSKNLLIFFIFFKSQPIK